MAWRKAAGPSEKRRLPCTALVSLRQTAPIRSSSQGSKCLRAWRQPSNFLPAHLNLSQHPTQPPIRRRRRRRPMGILQKFDCIHGRMLSSCFKSHLEIFRSALESLKLGGWIELQDTGVFAYIDDSDKGTAFARWRYSCLEAVKKMGRTFDWDRSLPLLFSSVYFVWVVQDVDMSYRLPNTEVSCINIVVHSYACLLGPGHEAHA
jgi:hypothetical protein